jgi:phospholipid/cholesterol/gamma-HCH transport system permease protein
VKGRLEFSEAVAIWSEANKLLRSQASARVDFDLSEVTSVDGAAMALLVHVRHRLGDEGKASEFVGASPNVQDIVHLYEGDVHLPTRKKRKAESVLSQIGRATLEILGEAQRVFAFFGQMIISAIATVRAPRSANWKDLMPTMERTGARSWCSSTSSSGSSWRFRARCSSSSSARTSSSPISWALP